MAAARHSIGNTLAASLAAFLLAGAAAHAPRAAAQSMIGSPPATSKAPANAKPTISGNPSRMLVAGSFYDFRPAASDPDSAHLQFSINKRPAWANFDSSTGRLYGTPSSIDVGKIKGIQISVSDGQKRAALKKFGIKVIAGQPPVISGTPTTKATEGQAYQFQPSASDGDKQDLQFAISNRPAWASFDKFTGRLHGTPPAGSAGTYAGIGISVTDGATTVSLPAFTITVAPGVAAKAPNTPAKISGVPLTSVQVGQNYDFTPSASDPDDDTLTFASVNVPEWLDFDRATGRLYGKPAAGQEGTYSDIVISVNDGSAFTFLAPFAITVTSAPAPTPPPVENRAPSISGTPAAGVEEGKAYTFQPSATDADGDALTFSATNLPAWLTINAATGRVTGTAPTGSAGTYSGIVVSVSDGRASASLPPFAVTVTALAPSNQPPTLSGRPATVAVVGQMYAFEPTAIDPEGQALRFAISNKPVWLTFDFATGRLSGVPYDADLGTYANIVIGVSDGTTTVRLPAFSITVQATAGSENKPPVISGTPATSVTVGQAYSFRATANDPDGQELRFGIANKPSWANFDIVTGLLSGTPTQAHVGSYGNIVISVSDGTASASLPAFSISVQAAQVENRAPTISGSPATTATEGTAYSFQPTASDPDGDTLTFSISGQPSWASFSSSSGRLSGTPPTGSAGSYGPVVISVSDGKVSAALASFTITVSPKPNTAPTISGTPATSVTVGQPYSFRATANDPDGQELRFGIANKPSWANFDIVTGLLSGTPTQAHVGSYGNIVISVSDGTASATLPAFSINVVAPVTGSAELNWTAPTQNEDGSALTNLAGYKIRYGTSPGALDKLLDVVGAGINSATIENLAAGTWYFSMTSYTNTGVESAPTGMVTKTIQ